MKPLDKETIRSSVQKTKRVITIEDNIIKGGLGSTIEEFLIEERMEKIEIKTFGYPDEFIKQGTVEEIEEKYGLDAKTIAEFITKNTIYQ